MMKRKFTLFLASGFGLGLIVPFAPGTFGSLPGLALAYLTTLMPLWIQIALCTVLTLAAIPVCDAAEKILGIKDDGRICADEWMLFPLSVIGLPLL
jgi:phosphatidylglycerophosphatase A